LADSAVLKVSRATSVILLIIYLLYLVFQLKSHAYMYESTPQAIIDEESHPGVLADIMNSSSSSDDSSSSDSSDSDGSIMTTGKRVRRMFKNRKRRKSSVSAGSTRSPSVIVSTSSPSVNQPDNYWDHHHNSHGSTNRPRLGDIASGDEADEDGAISPRIRDFGSVSGPTENPSKGARKHRKKHSRHKHRKSRRDSAKDAVDEPERSVQLTDDPRPEHRVEFSDDVQVAENQATVMPPSRRAFNMRQYRPALPKVLSNNVFVQPSPYVVQSSRPALPLRSVSEATGLRRTNSLPDRLAKQQNTVTPNIVNRTGPLPPYQHQRVTSSRSNADKADQVSVDSDDDGPVIMSRTAAVILLLCSTCLVAVCAEFMVDAIPDMIADSPSVSQAFIGLIILPIVGNAAEHVTAVTVATKNKMDLAIGVAVGSSIQIALFVTPIVVLLGWILHTDMSLYFNLFETVSLVATAFVINFLILDGRSNYLEGSLLIAVYVIIAVVAFFYPETAAQSEIGGGGEEAHMARRAAGEIFNVVGQVLQK
jgi:Ca2+:H+ antiporter